MPILDMNGCQLFYEERGNGLPLLFIHPPLLTHLTFQRQLEQLSQDYRVICFDIRGHGKSSESREPVTYPLIVQDVLHLIDHLRLEKVILCGYSTGGGIVLEALLTAPENFAGGVVISGMSEVSDRLLRNQFVAVLALMKLKLKPLLAARTVFTNSDSLGLYWEHLKACTKGNSQNIEQYFRYSLDYRCTEQLNEIKTPILLVYGSKDKGFLRYARILQDKLPHRILHVIPNVDHRIPTKKPAELHHLIKGWMTDMETKEPE